MAIRYARATSALLLQARHRQRHFGARCQRCLRVFESKRPKYSVRFAHFRNNLHALLLWLCILFELISRCVKTAAVMILIEKMSVLRPHKCRILRRTQRSPVYASLHTLNTPLLQSRRARWTSMSLRAPIYRTCHRNASLVGVLRLLELVLRNARALDDRRRANAWRRRPNDARRYGRRYAAPTQRASSSSSSRRRRWRRRRSFARARRRTSRRRCSARKRRRQFERRPERRRRLVRLPIGLIAALINTLNNLVRIRRHSANALHRHNRPKQSDRRWRRREIARYCWRRGRTIRASALLSAAPRPKTKQQQQNKKNKKENSIALLHTKHELVVCLFAPPRSPYLHTRICSHISFSPLPASSLFCLLFSSLSLSLHQSKIGSTGSVDPNAIVYALQLDEIINFAPRLISALIDPAPSRRPFSSFLAASSFSSFDRKQKRVYTPPLPPSSHFSCARSLIGDRFH